MTKPTPSNAAWVPVVRALDAGPDKRLESEKPFKTNGREHVLASEYCSA